MMAEVMAFYGIGWGEMLTIPVSWFCKLYRHVATVEARRLLAWLEPLSFPHLATEEARRSVRERLMRQSGYERLRQEAEAATGYASGWDALRGLAGGRKHKGT